jgi:hypothetical protein
MKAKLAVIALGAFVLMANGANAMIRIDPRKTRPRVLVGKVLVGFALAAFLISVPPTWVELALPPRRSASQSRRNFA